MVSTTVTPSRRNGVDQLLHQQSGMSVHNRGGLVEEHQLGTADQRASQGEPLLLPAAESPIGGARGVGEA